MSESSEPTGSFSKGLGQWRGTAEVYGPDGVFLGEGRDTRSVEADDGVRVLQQQAAQWNDGSRSGITSGLTEDAVMVDAYFSSNPAKWLIVFAQTIQM